MILERGSSTIAFWLFLTVGALCLSVPAPAIADDPAAREKARGIVVEGAKLYERGDLAAALAHFQSAYAVFPSPKIQYNLGLAYAGLARHGQALNAFERFVREARDADPAQLAEARRQVGRLSSKVGFVTVSGVSDGAEVLLDGVLIGATPLPGRVAVDVGQHAVVVRSPTAGSWTQSFSVAAGRSLALKVQGRASVAQTAASISEAERLVLGGVELRKQRKHLEAYEYFRRAFEISPTARPAAQLGLVEYQLGRWVDAEAHLELASQAVDPFIEQNRATIQEALETVRTHIAFVEVKGAPSGSEVSINGRKVGQLPLSGLIKTGAGYAEVVVSAPGHVTAHRTVAVQPQLTEQLFVALQPLDSMAGTAPSGRSRETVAMGPGGSLDNAFAARGGGTLRTAGLLVALIGLGGVGYGAFQSYRVHALTREVASTDPKGIQRGRAAERQQWWAYGLGVAAVGAGGLLFKFGGADKGTLGSSVSLEIAPLPRSLLVSLNLK